MQLHISSLEEKSPFFLYQRSADIHRMLQFCFERNRRILRIGLPGWLSGKESACQSSQSTGLIRGLKRSPGGGNGNPLKYSCLGNPMDRGAWLATDHGVAKNQIRLSN